MPVLIDPGMGIRNLGRCLAEAEPEAFIGIPRARESRLGESTPRSRRGPRPRSRLLVDRSATAGAGHLSNLADRPRRTSRAVLVADRARRHRRHPLHQRQHRAAQGGVYTHAIFRAQVDMLRDLYGIEPGEIDLCTFPLFALFAPALGMTSIVPEMDATRPAQVDPTKILDAIENFGVTNMFGSPALI